MPSTGSRGSRPRRTWAQRALISLNALAVVAAAVTATTLAYSNERVSEVTRTVIPQGVLREPSAAGLEGVQNFLIVGVDDASRLADGDDVKKRETTGKLTDTIMVLRLDPVAVTADLLSFPRDLYVPIAGSRASGRINSAFNVGGPVRLIQTLDEDFGIPIDHYVELDFAGFRELVDVVGGVPVQFPRPARSAGTVELAIPEAGCWVLGPRQALGFARARKDYQVRDEDGRWHTDLGGDYSRVERQQLFVQLALRQAITKGARNPNTLRRLVELGARSTTVDTGLEPDLIVALGRAFRTFDPADLVTYTLPVDEDEPGGPAYLFLREAEAEPILSVFRDGGTSHGDLRPDEVTVRVRNGTGAPGQAAEVTFALAAAGFSTIVPDADVPQGYPTLLVHAAGAEAQAHLVARQLNGPATYLVGETPGDVDVVLITGSDWFGVGPALRPADEVPAPADLAPPTDEAPATTSTPDDAATEVTAPGGTVPRAVVIAAAGPDQPEFYLAEEPPPDAVCRPTP